MGTTERREREKARRRSQILSAARDLLLTRGLSRTSVNQIAKRAEVSVATIYGYFASREEIIADLSEEALHLLHAGVQQATARAETPRMTLEAVAWAYLDFALSHRAYFSVLNYFLTAPAQVLSLALKRRVHAQGDRILALVMEAAAAGVAAGTFEPVEIRRFALVFWATLNGILQLRKLEDTLLGEESVETVYRYAVTRLMDDLCRRS